MTGCIPSNHVQQRARVRENDRRRARAARQASKGERRSRASSITLQVSDSFYSPVVGENHLTKFPFDVQVEADTAGRGRQHSRPSWNEGKESGCCDWKEADQNRCKRSATNIRRRVASDSQSRGQHLDHR